MVSRDPERRYQRDKVGCAYIIHPKVGYHIARGETESLEYMAFGLCRLTHKIFGQTNIAMSSGQIAVKQ
jgi:hypothetical protein